jgi:hypothetical protein
MLDALTNEGRVRQRLRIKRYLRRVHGMDCKGMTDLHVLWAEAKHAAYVEKRARHWVEMYKLAKLDPNLIEV